MIVVVQFPIADGRGFLAGGGHRLPHPDWESPRLDVVRDFVHHFGSLQERRRGPDAAWADEKAYCRAKRGLRFPTDPFHAAEFPPGTRAKVLFRRLFCDGKVTARIEVGFKVVFPAPAATDPITILRATRDVCELMSVVTQPGVPDKAGLLVRQGRRLARLYARASRPSAGSDTDDAVEDGRPMVLVELETAMSEPLPGFTVIRPEATTGAGLSFGRLQTRAGEVPLWVIQPGPTPSPPFRSLRLCLLRLHVEQEVLDVIARRVAAGSIPPPDDRERADALYHYLNTATRAVRRPNWYGVEQSSILAAVDAYEKVIPAASRTVFEKRHEYARTTVLRKVEEYRYHREASRTATVIHIEEGGSYVEKQVIVNGDGNIVNVAEYMNDVTNTVNQTVSKSAADDQVKKLIKELTDRLNAAVPNLDAKTAKEMGQDVTTLGQEVAGTKRRRWYELSLEGLKDAATAIGEIGKPILETVKLLWPLLLP